MQTVSSDFTFIQPPKRFTRGNVLYISGYIVLANITLTSSWNIFSCSTTERCDTIGPKLLAQEFRMADQTSVNAAMINF